jgi:lysophospholipase L1-like esterase
MHGGLVTVQRFVAAIGLAALTTLFLTGSAQATIDSAGFEARQAPPPTFKKYVALGDSYTSAPLVPPLDLTSLGCLRSLSNYPHLLATKLKVPKVTDVSCGGADSTHMLRPQSTPVGYVPPQLSVLTEDTDLVTVGVGANDFGVFSDLFTTCPRLQPSDPGGAPCQKHFARGGQDELRENIARTGVRLVQVVKEIKERAPKATVVLVGYPQIAPKTGACPKVPFAKGDYAYLYSIEDHLNKAIQEAVKDTNAKYLDTFKPFTGHDACAAPGKAWIQGKDPDLMKAASYHPLPEGQVAVADLAFKLLSGQ